MKARHIIFCGLFLMAYGVYGQKNLVPQTQSTLTGITLPANTKEDKRMLMRVAAKATLDMEAKDSGMLLGELYEVYLLMPMAPQALADSITNALAAKGWQMQGSFDGRKWAIASKDTKQVMVYLEARKKESSLYLADVQFAVLVSNQSTPDNGNPAADRKPDNERNTETSVQQTFTPKAIGNYSFTTTNFDDGWTSTQQNDYVLVEKGENAVYLLYHVPYNASQFSGTGIRDAEYYWDNYVTKYFNTKTKQFNDGTSIALKPPYMEGYGTDLRTGKTCFIGMYLLIVPNATSIVIGTAPNEASFRKLYPKANEFSGSDLADMERYNKFAISAADLLGKWQNGNTETAQWYYVSPAGYESYAGMTLAATSATFLFNDNGSYTSIHNGATGAVGNMTSFQQEYKGSYSASNWAITATNRWQGQTSRFDAYFKAVRGGRILCLNDAGTRYSLLRTQ